jgi:hypothetical protein
MPVYHYLNMCLMGAIGISDYSFGCIIEAETADDALAWGHEVARAYNREYGLLPNGERIEDAEIVNNASVIPDVQMRCRAGEMPDLAKYRAGQELLAKFWRYGDAREAGDEPAAILQSTMPIYCYTNECMTGVLGVSDYGFQCTIEAETAEQALAWGHEVARAYNREYGLLPNGNKLNEATIPQNGSVIPDAQMRCRVGEMPDLGKYHSDQHLVEQFWREHDDQ